MNYEVTKRERPTDSGDFGSGLFHVAEQYGSRSLCGHSCSVDEGWEAREGMHPEDVDAIDRCSGCYAALAAPRADNRWDPYAGSLFSR